MFEMHTTFMLPVRRDTTKLGITERTLAVPVPIPGSPLVRTPGLVEGVALLPSAQCTG